MIEGNMRRHYFIPLALAVSLLSSGYTVTPPYCLTDPWRPHIAGAQTIVHDYLDAVDRGELRTFDQKLERTDIIPVRIEYVYQISSEQIEIRVYSNLKEPLPIPNQPGAQVNAVSSSIENGRIVETESHVWIK